MKPLIYTSTLGIICLLAEMLNLRKLILPVCVVGLCAILGVTVMEWNVDQTAAEQSIYNMLHFDHFSMAFSALLIVLAILLLLLSGDFYQKEESKISDYIAIILFTLCGGMAMVSFGNMAMLFLGIEVLSISLYILAGSNRKSVRSNEAGMKYFLMGSFASGFLLFGMALIYGVTGSFNIAEIGDYMTATEPSMMVIVGVAMILVALLFKVSAAPFHFWAPDVYEGSPTLTTAMMSTLSKIAAFAAFYKLFSACFIPTMPAFAWAMSIITALTITIGNFGALWQDSFKRMLAFSGVSHAGYLMLAIITLYGKTDSALFFYSTAYGISSIAAFAIAILVAKATGSEKISAFNGLGKRHPLLAVALTISMLSLAGIPPLAGFFGKYYIFSEAIRNGRFLITIVAVVNSIVAVYYYFKVILAMFTEEAEGTEAMIIPLAYSFVIALCVLVALALGVYPGAIAGLL